MAKNPLITDVVKRVIAEIYLKHSDWRAKEIRDGVEARLHEQNLHPKPGWPGLSAVQKELKKIHEKQSKTPPDPEDKPWNVVTLADYDMPAEALPVLLLIWSKSQWKPDEPLTIREAKWVARLYRTVSNIEYLYVYAKHYADEEKISKLTGTPLRVITNASFSDLNTNRPALQPLLSRIKGGGLPDLEMVVMSIFETPQKIAERRGKEATKQAMAAWQVDEETVNEIVKEGLAELRVEMAEVVKAAGLPGVFLRLLELYESIEKGGTK